MTASHWSEVVPSARVREVAHDLAVRSVMVTSGKYSVRMQLRLRIAGDRAMERREHT